MSDINTIEARLRQRTGTGGARAVRREGRLPGIVYGGATDPVSISIDPREVEKHVHHKSFYARLYELNLNGVKERVLPRAVQKHLINEMPTHIDFLRVVKGDVLTVSVPVFFTNEEECPGLKRGGVLNIVMHEIELNCPVNNIPEKLEIDLSGLDIHDSVHLAKITLPEGVVAAHPDSDDTLATLVAPSSVKSAGTSSDDEDETADETGDSASEAKKAAE